MQKERGFSMQFLLYGQQDSWLDQETYNWHLIYVSGGGGETAEKSDD